MKFIILLILLCAVSINAQMNEIYVSPSGSDTNNGSETSPFKTIERGIYELVRYGGPEPGATVYLIKGVNGDSIFYYDILNISDNDIIIKTKYPSQNIIITKTLNYQNNKLINITGYGITIDGITIKNIHHGWPIYIEGNNNIIKNCKILGSQRDGISIIKSNNNLIYNNYIAMDTLITRIFPANAITIEGIWENLFFEPASNNIIQQNHIVSSTSHHGINVMNTYLTTPPPNKDTLLNYGNIIRDNFIDRCQAGIYIRKQKDFQIFNNIICRSYSTKPNSDDIDESDEGHAIKLAYDGTADSYSFMANGKIYNNLFYNYLNCGIYSEYAKQIYIYNNIFVKNMTLGNSSNGDEFIRVNSPEASEIKYNFYFKNHNGYPLSDTSFKWYNGLLVKGYRSWSINYEPTSISPGNPFFVDSAKNDFHYTCWSRLLINRGNNVNNSLVNKDMEGRTRLNSTWDLGPYEWNGTWCDSPNEISFNDTSLILSFAEPLDESLMLNTENYETHESININEVKLLNDKKILILTNKHKKPSKYYLRVKNLKFANKENIYNDLTFLYEYDSTLSKETSAKEYLPDFELDQNYPNPFNPDTEIKFSLNGDGIVCLKVYNILGKEITTLVNEHKSQGNYTINFDGKDLTSGFYIYTLQYKNQLISKKMLLLK